MGLSDDDSVASDTPQPPLVLVDAEGNEYDPKGKSYKYRDFSHVNEDDEEALGENSSPPPTRNTMETSIRVQKFPVKLYAILAQKEFHDIITWMPHGRSWKVLKPNIFETMVMPLFFEYSNYHSFNRLVNAWSFRRVSSGPDRGSYYHELFLRGKPHLQKYMRRLPKTHKKLPMQKHDEPDFYRLDQTNPLPALSDAPIPGGLLAPSAISGAAGLTEKRDLPNTVSPAGSAGLPQSSFLTAPQPQRLVPSVIYNSGSSGLDATGIPSNSFQDEYNDLYIAQQEQSLIMPQQQVQQVSMTREAMAYQDAALLPQMSRGGILHSSAGQEAALLPQMPRGSILRSSPGQEAALLSQMPRGGMLHTSSGQDAASLPQMSRGGMMHSSSGQDTASLPQISRGGILHSSSGAFRSTGAPVLQPQRFRPSMVSMLDTNGMNSMGGMPMGGGFESEVGQFTPAQMANRRAGPVLANHTEQMNSRLGKMVSTYDRMGQMGVSHMDPRQVPSQIHQQQMNPAIRNAAGMRTMPNNTFNDMPQHRQLQMNMFQRETGIYGVDGINSNGLSGSINAGFSEDFGVASAMPMGSAYFPSSYTGHCQ